MVNVHQCNRKQQLKNYLWKPSRIFTYTCTQAQVEQSRDRLCADTKYNSACGLHSSWNLLFLRVFMFGPLPRLVKHVQLFVIQTHRTVPKTGFDKTEKTNWNMTLNCIFRDQLLPVRKKAAFPALSSSLALLLAVKPFQLEGHQSWAASFRATLTLICLFTLLIQHCGETSSGMPSLRSVTTAVRHVSGGLPHCLSFYCLKHSWHEHELAALGDYAETPQQNITYMCLEVRNKKLERLVAEISQNLRNSSSFLSDNLR